MALFGSFRPVTSTMEPTPASVPAAPLLPEPARRARKFPLISVDDHVVEPRDAFAGRLPARFGDRGPRVVKLEDGAEAWVIDDCAVPQALARFNAAAGRALAKGLRAHNAQDRFDQMHPGVFDIHRRIHDMDIDGVYASLNFPSALAGFGGARLQTISEDLDLSFALVRAYNSWHLEDWAGPYPERIIPCQIPWLHDVDIAAREIERNAALGFKAVTFPECPSWLDLPSIHSGYWDPFLRACEETDTVVCLHTGSATRLISNSPDAPPEAANALFGAYAVFTAIDWLFSLCAVRFPDIKICFTEGGIGWLPGIIDRLLHQNRRFADIAPGTPGPFPPAGMWAQHDITPVELLLRNFWFCALDDFAAFRDIDRIGPDHVLAEVDYPHADGTWPNSHVHIASELEGLSRDIVERVTWRNASALYRHPVPESVQRDPDSF
jgi:predicted TIM-barrel fold metal-dependent hydrolase